MLNSFWSNEHISRPGDEDDIEADEAVTNCHRRSSTVIDTLTASPRFAEKDTASTSLLRSVPNTYRLIDGKFFKRARFEGGFEMKVAKWLVLLVAKKMFCSCVGNTIFQDRQYMKS